MTIRYGVIGCGGHAVQGHIEVADSAELQLVAVCDPDPERMAAAMQAAKVQARMFRSAEELMQDGGVELVIITSPDEYHPGQLAAAVAAGKHVLVDKPLAVDARGMAVVRQSLREAEKQGLVVTSCHPRRFDPPYMWIESRLSGLEAQHGPLQHVELDFTYHQPVASWKHARSLLLDHFPHEIDFLRWLTGDMPFTAYRLKDSHDAYRVAGVLDSGLTFDFGGTRMLGAKIYPEDIRLRFARAECTVNTKLGTVTLYDHEDQTVGTQPAPVTDYDHRFTETMYDLARAIRGEAPSYLTPRDLEVNTASAIALADEGVYRYGG